MRIELQSVKIQNFMGIVDRAYEFGPGLNRIIGRNRAGKSNSINAIVWCLFGKDIDDRKKFNIVPLNPDQSAQKVEPMVELTILVNDKAHVFKRQLKGNTTVCEIDGAPKKVGEFDDFIANIFGSEERFKMFSINGINSMFSSIVNAVGGVGSTVISKAKTWGTDMMQGLANGIRNGISNVRGAVTSVADTITSFLHFSRPDVGPLREYEEWMPDMLSGMATGIKNNTGRVISETKKLSDQMAKSLTANVDISSVSATQTTPVSSYSAIATSGATGSAGISTERLGLLSDKIVGGIREAMAVVGDKQAGDTVVNVYLDGVYDSTIRTGKRKNIRAGKVVVPVGG